MPPILAIQLYTLRDHCARDFRGTLGAVRELGFGGVELAGLNGHAAGEVRSWLDALGLVAVSAHASDEDLAARPQAVVEDARSLGYTRVVMPWTNARTRDETTALLGRLRCAGAVLAGAGVSLGYHNHDFELLRRADGSRMLDQILAEPSLFLEPDLGWLWYAGEDPGAFLLAHRTRCPLVHIKDFRNRTERSFCPVGAGAVGYAGLVPAAAALGVDSLIIEQDESPDQDPLEACRASIAFVRRALDATTKE
ncbi:MAG: sugar phosphate isomerase/epimerase [Phycisphaerales bacterium]|nr:sugar phosphate isomerase/epimerase [Phycisphaerales bacterium]